MSNSIKSTLLHVVFFVLAVSVVTVRSTCAEGYDFVACEVGGSYLFGMLIMCNGTDLPKISDDRRGSLT
ncbi:hypothetical protein MJO28_012630 [Puccinia striiformis f. sp. tritici]|uniref:Uncharacterized protein n=1 Tax=Puccinia striiformis f. sp. tritici TaxID=168172 RepID=A0ACC0E3G1_9BASI|nr:hypothetical protein MJO28_012630 [Puccinia striiformis f. sp. tritici]KAI9611160.1 hypothetical protein KEM48_004632 [Puccinia striiformis f. sp. tritici PST-130]